MKGLCETKKRKMGFCPKQGKNEKDFSFAADTKKITEKMIFLCICFFFSILLFSIFYRGGGEEKKEKQTRRKC